MTLPAGFGVTYDNDYQLTEEGDNMSNKKDSSPTWLPEESPSQQLQEKASDDLRFKSTASWSSDKNIEFNYKNLSQYVDSKKRNWWRNMPGKLSFGSFNNE